MYKKNKLIILILLFMIILSSCSGPESNIKHEKDTESNNKSNSQIVYGSVLEPHGTFNPLLSYMGLDMDIEDIVYASLLQVGLDGEMQPYLAESYEVSENQKDLKFTLHKNAKWHDGTPLTTSDVEYTILTMANPNFSGGGFNIVKNIIGAKEFNEGKSEGIDGIEIIDDHTIVLHFEDIYAPVLTKLGARGIVPKHIWEEIPIDKWEEQTDMLNYPVGSGPYKVSEYKTGQYVKLESFDDFFGGKPNTETIIFKIINEDSISAEFQSGNIDIAGVKNLKSTEVETLKDLGIEIREYPDNMYQYIAMNLRMPIFQDKNLRQALNYCLDRQLILEKIVENRGELLDAPFIPSGWAAPEKNILNKYEYNPDKAIQLLEESGWTEFDKDGIRMNENGEKLSFPLRCSNDSKMRQEAVLFFKESAKNIGVDIDVTIEEDAKMAEDCIFNHNFEMYALNCYFGAHPDPYGWWHSNSATDEIGVGSFNFGSYKNEIVDENIEKANLTFNQEEAKEYYLNVAKQINEDVPMIFLYVQNREMAHNPNLEGYNPSTFNEFYNIKDWIIK